MKRSPFRRKTGLAGAVFISALGIGLAGASARPARADMLAATCGLSTSSVQQLATIDHANEIGYQCLGLSVDGDEVKAIRLETHNFAFSRGQRHPEQVVIDEFPVAVLASKRGAVLDGVPGHDAIILQGRIATPPRRTELVTSYLYNGFTGEYRSCPLILDRAPGAGWRLVNRFSRTISHIVVRTRDMPLIGPIGIADLEGACS